MFLIRRICMELQKPVFEVMKWPASELGYWSLFFSIKSTDKPIIKQKKADTISVTESKAQFKALFR